MRRQVMWMLSTGFIRCVCVCVAGRTLSSGCACRMHVFQANSECCNNAATCEPCIFRENQSLRFRTRNITRPWFCFSSCFSHENSVDIGPHFQHGQRGTTSPGRRNNGPQLQKHCDIISLGETRAKVREHKDLNGGDLEGCMFTSHVSYIYISTHGMMYCICIGMSYVYTYFEGCMYSMSIKPKYYRLSW